MSQHKELGGKPWGESYQHLLSVCDYKKGDDIQTEGVITRKEYSERLSGA